MTRMLTLAALTAGLVAASASGAQAQYRAQPTASLGGSCQNVQTLQTGYVTAECRDDQGRYRWSSIYYPQCRSDLMNQNGVLACQGATGNAGGYVDQAAPQGSTAASVIGAIAQAMLGVGGGQSANMPGTGDPTWGQPGYGTHQTWVPMASRQTWLEGRISAGQTSRALSTQDADRLRAEFQSIARLEAQYARNGMTDAEQADLDRRFDALSAKIPGAPQYGQYGWDSINQRQAQIDARIDAGLRDRTLTTQDAARLRAEFRDIARLETQYVQGGMTSAQQADLDRRFEALNARIPGQGQYGQYGWQSIDQRQVQVDARIDAGLRDRTLTTQEAARLRAEFREIARLETQYMQGGMTSAQQADLDRRFEALSARIPGQDQFGQYGWESISQRQAQFDARIDAAVRGRTLTTQNAMRLRAEFQKIARLESQYSQGGLTNAEQADLDRRYSALAARVPGQRPY
ncbi:MAG: hypothetical protein Q7V15_10170 [Phenylobacterium sp.]|uniref:hypothetical protein n=1 Tax=Phenylobacterium sp. TaxID=1871053 RepID=UPI002723EAC9|nr:hypothetical protein [Phenylobacterium sp.]MDO8901709.1 hypothetical protein [Phenylobacterium sp.]